MLRIFSQEIALKSIWVFACQWGFDSWSAKAEYGERWGEGAARYFSIEADFLDEATSNWEWCDAGCFLLEWNTRLLSDSNIFEKVSVLSAQDQSIRLMPVPESHHLKTCSEEQKQVMRLIYHDLPEHGLQMTTMEGFFCPISATIMPAAQICVQHCCHSRVWVLLTGQIQWQLSMVAPMRGTTLKGLVFAMSNGDVLNRFDMFCYGLIMSDMSWCLGSQVVQSKATSQSGHHFSSHRPLKPLQSE